MGDSLLNFLKEIFGIKEAVWLVIGMILPSIISSIQKIIRRFRVKIKIKNEEVKFTDKGIVSLGHGDPYYIMNDGREDISLGLPNESFHLNFPNEILKEILKIKPEFMNTTWQDEEKQEFLDNDTLENFYLEAANNLNISKDRFIEIYENKKIEIANLFLQKLKNSEPYFNGEMYGIRNLNTSREKVDEISTVKIKSYKSDYYTHRVMATIYQEVYKENPEIAPKELDEYYNNMKYYLTSIGLNVLLILEDERLVVFAKRSGKLINMTRDMWHVSMNEAISITDRTENSSRISLNKCVLRGLNEELGIDIDDGSDFSYTVFYGDVFLLQNPLETGITAFVILKNLTYNDLKIAYSAAKDKELETCDLISVRFNKNDLKKFVKNNNTEITETCKYVIKMLIARLMKKVINVE